MKQSSRGIDANHQVRSLRPKQALPKTDMRMVNPGTPPSLLVSSSHWLQWISSSCYLFQNSPYQHVREGYLATPVKRSHNMTRAPPSSMGNLAIPPSPLRSLDKLLLFRACFVSFFLFNVSILDVSKSQRPGCPACSLALPCLHRRLKPHPELY